MANELETFIPDLITPRPFVLSEQDSSAKDKIMVEVMDKVKDSEKRMNTFYAEMQDYIKSWKIEPRNSGSKKPIGLSNAKSGETHRGTETLATLWLRMLTAQDQFFEGTAEGLNDFGQEMSELDIYTAEAIILKQLRKSHYKEKLLKGTRSVALFGTVIFEEPWVGLPYGDGTKTFEYTDFQLRSLLQTMFDTTVFDIDMSDFMAVVDYVSKYRLRNMYTIDSETWDRAKIEEQISQYGSNLNLATNTWHRIRESKQRMGYEGNDSSVMELVSYHGRLDSENPMIQSYMESVGLQEDPKFIDFSVKVLNGESIVQFHVTPYKTWHSRFKVAHYKLFELEPVGYGVGRIGRKSQRELDVTTSRMNDLLLFSLYSIWKVGRFAGLKANQFNIKPWNIVELEDISQLEPIRPDINAIAHALAMQGITREEFRASTGASSNLQAIATKASATEATLTQNEAIRAGSVHAEIISETLLREHIEQMHINNLNLLDDHIWVRVTGENKPRLVNKENLQSNIGFIIKVVTDKDFRPERLQKLLELIQIITSVRNFMPSSMNALEPTIEEAFRALGMNPRLLHKPIPVADQLINALQKQQRIGQNTNLLNEVEGERAGAEAGSGANISTPLGLVPSSPLGAGGLSSGI